MQHTQNNDIQRVTLEEQFQWVKRETYNHIHINEYKLSSTVRYFEWSRNLQNLFVCRFLSLGTSEWARWLWEISSAESKPTRCLNEVLSLVEIYSDTVLWLDEIISYAIENQSSLLSLWHRELMSATGSKPQTSDGLTLPICLNLNSKHDHN